MTEGQIRVLIIDDHEEARQALAACLGASPQIDVVAATGRAEEGLIKAAALQPDIVLVDPKRSDGRGLEVLHRLLKSDLRVQVIVLTSYLVSWEEWVAHGDGVARYLLKEIDCAQLVRHILTVVSIGVAAVTGWD